MLGTGRGRVSQAPLAEEIVDFLETVEKLGSGGKIQEIRQGAKRFFLNYVKALSTTFPAAWASRKYSIKTGAALRAFIRAAPDVMARTRELKRDPFDLNAIREAIKPRSEEHTSELQSRLHLVCRLLLEKKKNDNQPAQHHDRR